MADCESANQDQGKKVSQGDGETSQNLYRAMLKSIEVT